VTEHILFGGNISFMH